MPNADKPSVEQLAAKVLKAMQDLVEYKASWIEKHTAICREAPTLDAEDALDEFLTWFD